jgi:transcriptional regulator with XRE-family HTH domain
MSALEQNRLPHPLRLARSERGWTQQKLADLIGVTALEVGRWERGEASPHPLYREKLCKLFDSTAEKLGIQRATSKDAVLPHDTHFLFNEPPSTLEDFYGREHERHRLIERTKKKAATSIVGPRRIGKTWLLYYLRLVAPELLGPSFRIGYLDASSIINSSVATFTEEALRQLSLPAPDVSKGLVDLHYGIRTLPPGCVPILCIDKFESIVSRHSEFTETFYQGLRSMSQSLVLIIISRKSLFDLFSGTNAEQEQDELTSPFSNIFEQLTLRPFNHKEAEQFIEKKGRAAGLSQGEQQYFWEYGKVGEQHWSPVLLQSIGKILMEDRHHYNTKNPDYSVYFGQHFREIQRGLGKL